MCPLIECMRRRHGDGAGGEVVVVLSDDRIDDGPTSTDACMTYTKLDLVHGSGNSNKQKKNLSKKKTMPPAQTAAVSLKVAFADDDVISRRTRAQGHTLYSSPARPLAPAAVRHRARILLDRSDVQRPIDRIMRRCFFLGNRSSIDATVCLRLRPTR